MDKGFEKFDTEAAHLSSVGDPRQRLRVIMEWARAKGYIFLNHGLNFGSLLAATGVETPSVIQLRTQDILLTSIENLVISTLRQFEEELMQGALVTVDKAQSSARILSIR
ncbi:MAG: hypothetical protein PUP92_27790 [Rhizonema sp. PD38]|nr:hypothetical protein [Rhizonema sp. PD38]